MRNKYFWAALLWTVFVTVLCLISADNFDELEKIEMPAKDKFLHGIFYFIFTVLWYLGFSRANIFTLYRSRLAAFLLAVAYGIFIEVCQGLFTRERTPDIIDALANTTGSAVALATLWMYHKKKKVNNNSPAY